jgi:hypothetical protein
MCYMYYFYCIVYCICIFGAGIHNTKYSAIHNIRGTRDEIRIILYFFNDGGSERGSVGVRRTRTLAPRR